MFGIFYGNIQLSSLLVGDQVVFAKVGAGKVEAVAVTAADSRGKLLSGGGRAGDVGWLEGEPSGLNDTVGLALLDKAWSSSSEGAKEGGDSDHGELHVDGLWWLFWSVERRFGRRLFICWMRF